MSGFLPVEELICERSARELSGKTQIYSLIVVDGPNQKNRKKSKGYYQKIFMIEGSKITNNKRKMASTVCIRRDDMPYLYSTSFLKNI